MRLLDEIEERVEIPVLKAERAIIQEATVQEVAKDSG
jgi:hypothetical protein